jgi:hypothetical protein
MRTFLLIAALVGGCTDPHEHYPVLPGSPVPATGSTGETTIIIAGRACVIVDDLRDFVTCSPTAGANLTVAVGNQRVVTAADGTFRIVASPNIDMTQFIVTGAGVIPSVTAVTSLTPPTATVINLPVASADMFGRVLAANGIVLTQGSGSIVGTLTRGGAPITGLTVTATPSPAFGPFFDGSTPTVWTLDATGVRGVFFAPGVAVGGANLTFTSLSTGTGEGSVAGIPVINGGVTFLDTQLP